jgi:hypothetical protein
MMMIKKESTSTNESFTMVLSFTTYVGKVAEKKDSK